MGRIGPPGRIEMVNAQAESVFGYPRAEMLKQPIEMLVPERFRTNHPAVRIGFVKVTAARPIALASYLYGLKKDGSEFPIEIGLNPIETDEGAMEIGRASCRERVKMPEDAVP